MRIYTDDTRTYYYADDTKVKGLTEVHINSLNDYFKHDLPIKVLLGESDLFANDHHREIYELKKDYRECGDRPLKLDFLEGMDDIEILMRVLDVYDADNIISDIVEESTFFNVEWFEETAIISDKCDNSKKIIWNGEEVTMINE